MTRATEAKKKRELRGAPADVAAKLLDEDRKSEVLELVAALAARNTDLEKMIASMRAAKNRGEHVSVEQLEIFLEKVRGEQHADLATANSALENVADEHAGRPDELKPPKQPAVRKPPPAALRRIANPIAVPAAERACPVCGAERRCVLHETTEVIELIPAEVVVRLDCREILACDKCDGEMVRAPMGDKVVEGGAYGSRLVADLVVNKYANGLPLYRIGEMLERLGLSMPSSSMADQITWATDLLRPLWRALIAKMISAVVMHVDGTSLPVRDKETGQQVVLGSLWGYVADGVYAMYLYTSTAKKAAQRPGEIGPEDLLRHRTGYVVADAAQIFDQSFKRPDLIEIGCNMHARRYFVKALDAGDARAAVPIKAFQALYDVEETIADREAAARLSARQARSRPVYEELVRWCETHRPLEPPSSLLGAAIRYLLNHRIALMRFLDDSVVPIDNGIVERLHRRPAIGRRNYLFAGSHAGGERAAIAYSILGTCKLTEVNPLDYLADVLPRLAREGVALGQVDELLPDAWKRARAAASK